MLDLVDELHNVVIEFNEESFMVKRHLRYVEKFRDFSSWQRLETIDISEIREHIAPLATPQKEDELARRFDYLMYSIMLGMLQQKNVNKPVEIVMGTAVLLSSITGIARIDNQRELINKVQTKEFWDDATILDMEIVREALRDLLQYIERAKTNIYYTNFSDAIIAVQEGEAIVNAEGLQNCKKKVEFYLKEHLDTMTVHKLRNNKKLTQTDMEQLENILWTELGSKSDYQKEYGDTPIGSLVRRIVGVDRAAVNEAFSEFLSEQRLNVNQIRFVNLIVNLFKDDMTTAKGIMAVLDNIKNNATDVIA